jgi:hypothetical protein
MVFDSSEIRDRVAQLRAAGVVHSIFGANGHRFELAPPIEVNALIAWEREHGVELPADYRDYLVALGNGGAGPSYGIFPLGMWDGLGGELVPIGDALGELRAPFPHREAWNLPAARFDPPDHADDDEEDAWNAQLDAEYYDPSLVNGAIWICDHGCALRTLLVITGSERGHVWADRRAENAGLVPHVGPDGRHLGFGDWYTAWLEQCLVQAAPGR